MMRLSIKAYQAALRRRALAGNICARVQTLSVAELAELDEKLLEIEKRRRGEAERRSR